MSIEGTVRSNDSTAAIFSAAFPRVNTPPPLPDLARGDPSAIEDVCRIRMHDFYLPHWQQLARTYVAALAGPHTDDPDLLEVSHDMRDRLFDDYGRPIEHDPGYVPTWRFDGFCGQLRVTLEDGSKWYVTVLAPAHFIGNLMSMARESQSKARLTF